MCPHFDVGKLLFDDKIVNVEGDVMFGVGIGIEDDINEDIKYETAFKTFDARDYSLIATIDTKKLVLNVCPSWDDFNLAVIEQTRPDQDNMESIVRLYDIGRQRAEEDHDEEEEDRNEDDDDDDDSDNSDADDCKYQIFCFRKMKLFMVWVHCFLLLTSLVLLTTLPLL